MTVDIEAMIKELPGDISHFGVKGMKWGTRKDRGTVTKEHAKKAALIAHEQVRGDIAELSMNYTTQKTLGDAVATELASHAKGYLLDAVGPSALASNTIMVGVRPVGTKALRTAVGVADRKTLSSAQRKEEERNGYVRDDDF